MIEQRTLQSLIEERIPFRRISTGWLVGKCQLCDDYKERAGFKFESGKIATNCWNCGKASVYEEFSGHISNKFRKILNGYSITDEEIDLVVNSAFFNKPAKTKINLASLTNVSTITKSISLPDGMTKVDWESDDPVNKKIVEYLSGRCIPSPLMGHYPFYFSNHLKNFVIIPIFRNGKLIYWQARSIINSVVRYKDAPVDRSAVMFNMDQLNHVSNEPLFVTEGIFDALMVNGVSTLGSQLSPAKLKLLHESKRRLVFVIDKDKNGKKLALDVISRGWEIALTPTGTQDINASVQRFGLSWTIQQLISSISDGNKALLSIECNTR